MTHKAIQTTQKTVTICGQQWRIRWTLRAMIAWEEAKGGKPFALANLGDYMLYLYCLFVTSNDVEHPDVADAVPYVAFIDAVGDDDATLQAFADIITDVGAKKKMTAVMNGKNPEG